MATAANTIQLATKAEIQTGTYSHPEAIHTRSLPPETADAVVFDIETGPQCQSWLLAMAGDFDPSTVKAGNLKDKEKIAAKIEEAREKYKQSIIEKAALSPETGELLAIGWLWEDETGRQYYSMNGDGDENEISMLRVFWHQFTESMLRGQRLIGFNSNHFDLPFLARRSWILGVPVPALAFDHRGYPNGQVFVDVMDRWRCGNRQEYISLDRLGYLMGISRKTEGFTGADFAGLWKDDREVAIEYLLGDLQNTFAIGRRMGVLGINNR